MRKIIKRIFLCVLLLPVVLLLLLTGTAVVLYTTADMKQPQISCDPVTPFRLEEKNGYRSYGGNYLRQSESGLWEISLRGDGFERGVAFGQLSKDLLYYQEKVFVNQIRELIPSDSYLKFLRFFLILFNRNLAGYVPQEYRDEIYGTSLSCTSEYNEIGTPYERQLNYHAAHDIGHAMQDYMLVGCSSFAVWGDKSADSTLLIGRNFDFYMGDDFARHKLVSFYRPSTGYNFASVGWAGMSGVLSGMNQTGLTVTINAAKSTMPTSAAMPISLLAREILQYASTIDEAYAIALKRHTFVSESLLIGSAIDGKAAIIEKSTDKTALFYPDANQVICTNHYQSDVFKDDPRNCENIATTDSPYRYERMEELLAQNYPVDITKAAGILRNHQGKENKNIGLGNEKAINQFIAHHSVIFAPEKRLMWVSTSPWQLGKYVAYQLDSLFNEPDFGHELYTSSLTIEADTMLQQQTYTDLLRYKELTKIIRTSIHQKTSLANSVLQEYQASNPELFYVYQLTGDYYRATGNAAQALASWQKALTKEIPRQSEKISIEEKIKQIISNDQ